MYSLLHYPLSSSKRSVFGSLRVRIFKCPCLFQVVFCPSIKFLRDFLDRDWIFFYNFQKVISKRWYLQEVIIKSLSIGFFLYVFFVWHLLYQLLLKIFHKVLLSFFLFYDEYFNIEYVDRKWENDRSIRLRILMFRCKGTLMNTLTFYLRHLRKKTQKFHDDVGHRRRTSQHQNLYHEDTPPSKRNKTHRPDFRIGRWIWPSGKSLKDWTV